MISNDDLQRVQEAAARLAAKGACTMLTIDVQSLVSIVCLVQLALLHPGITPYQRQKGIAFCEENIKTLGLQEKDLLLLGIGLAHPCVTQT
jgi:hypothetical protein